MVTNVLLQDGAGSPCVWAGGTWDISLSSAVFCFQSKTAEESLFKKKKQRRNKDFFRLKNKLKSVGTLSNKSVRLF